MADPPSVAHVLDIMDDEAAVRYESKLDIDIREFEESVPSFRVLGWTEDIVNGELERGVGGRMG